jgi:hypothetical protein
MALAFGPSAGTCILASTIASRAYPASFLIAAVVLQTWQGECSESKLPSILSISFICLCVCNSLKGAKLRFLTGGNAHRQVQKPRLHLT